MMRSVALSKESISTACIPNGPSVPSVEDETADRDTTFGMVSGEVRGCVNERKTATVKLLRAWTEIVLPDRRPRESIALQPC
jgi:hypothetical protein